MQPIMENLEAGPSKGGNQYIDVDLALGYKFPELTIVLNHCGAMAGPALLSTPALVDQWKAGITAVAAAGNQNIVCKLGGIQMAMNGFGTHPSFCSRVRPSGCVLKAHARARGCVCVFVGGWVDG